MIRRVGVVAVVAVLCGALSGCGTTPSRPGIFDRPQTSDDALPAGSFAALDASTVRYVGTDSGGDRYWVARQADRQSSSSSLCIVDGPVDAPVENWMVFCGGLPMSAVVGGGKTVEFQIAPVSLSTGTSEVVGNTLLVGTTTLPALAPADSVGDTPAATPRVSG